MREAGYLALVVALVLTISGFAAAEGSQGDRLQRARELSWSGDYEESLSLYQGILEQRSDDHALRREYGLVLLWAGREIDAIGEFEWVLYRDPSDAEIRLSLGRAHHYLGRSEKAVGHYVMALPSLEEDAAVIAEAVAVMRAAEKRELAEHWLARGLERHPRDPDLRTVRAAAWIDLGEFDDAERELNAVLAEHPDHAGAREALDRLGAERDSPLELAKTLGYSGRYRKAKRILRDYLRDHPKDREATLTLARFAGWSADYPESQALFRKLLRERPDDRELRIELADVTSWRGQYGEAQRMYTPLIAEEPGHEDAAKQLRELDQLRAPSAEPRMLWFSDSEDFTLWIAETEFQVSPRPGRTLSLRLDMSRTDGEVLRGYDPLTGDAIRDSEGSTGGGLRVGFTERPDRRFELGGELGGVSYSSGGFSPRVRAWITAWPTYRHVVQLDLRHEEAMPEVRSIESVLEGIEWTTLHLVHMYLGERFPSWTRLELGHFSDDPNFWAARTVLGYSVLKRPVEVDLLALGTAGDYSEQSPNYWSPENLLAYAAGIRFKKKIAERADLLLLAELGKIRSDGGSGDTYRIAPELKWEVNRQLELSLRYDHFESIREGEVYESNLVSVALRYRWPVPEP